MHYTDQQLLEGVQRRDLRSVARLITLSENRVPRAIGLQAELFKHTGHAHIIGVTGSPGAGKSTLVDCLARAWRDAGKSVAILAIDPTSPFTGGAILGDRIRMSKTSEDPNVFIRSMATRGALGGISRATLDAVQILDAAKFDCILIETVGVGQAEVDIIRTADTCCVVLVPGMGDGVQAIKAGILEIADLFIINKSDREGADLLQKDLRTLLSLSDHTEHSWLPPIARTVATTGEGIIEVVEGAEKHRTWLLSSEEGKKRKLSVLKDKIIKIAGDIVLNRIEGAPGVDLDAKVLQCYEKTTDPYSVAQALVDAAQNTFSQ